MNIAPHRTLSLALAAALAFGACSRPAAREPHPVQARAPEPAVAHAPPSRTWVGKLAPVDNAWVERTLRGLTLREKVGQMVLAWTGGGYSGPSTPEMQRLYGWVQREKVGGFIISNGTPGELAEKMNALQRRAPVPLLMVSDLESGPGMRLLGAGTDFPPVMGLAATGSDSLAFEVGRVTAEEGRAVGLHLTLSPVLDVNSNPRNPIINTRSFGEDPETVGRFAADVVRGVHAGGLMAMGKHFPGHGDTHADSHMELPEVTADRARLNSVDLPPFRAAIAAGLDGVLVGHIAVPNLTGDDVPASVSRKLTGDLLRGELGFGGLVSTDAMNMQGLTSRYGQGEAAVRAIQAGADILLQPTDIPAVLDAVTRAVADGRLTEARIDQSVRRLLEAKSRVRIERRATVDAAEMTRIVGSPAHRALAARVAERSITLVRDRRSLVPLAADARRVLSITYTDNGSPYAGISFDPLLRASGRQVDAAKVGERTTAAEFASLRARAANADVVIVSAYVNPMQYRGTVQAGSGFAAFVEELGRAGVPVVAVSFGSPYLLGSFPSVPAYLLAWGNAEVCQHAAARAILGDAPISGRLPVSLTAAESRGTGVMRPAALARAGR